MPLQPKRDQTAIGHLHPNTGLIFYSQGLANKTSVDAIQPPTPRAKQNVVLQFSQQLQINKYVGLLQENVRHDTKMIRCDAKMIRFQDFFCGYFFAISALLTLCIPFPDFRKDFITPASIARMSVGLDT